MSFQEFTLAVENHIKGFGYVIAGEINYLRSFKSWRQFKSALGYMVFLETIAFALFIWIIISKIVLAERDPLYRIIYERLARGQRIVVRFKERARRNIEISWSGIGTLIAIILVMVLLKFQIRLVVHMSHILYDSKENTNSMEFLKTIRNY